MARKYRVTQVTPTSTPADRANYDLEQAAERQRRGFTGFTRPGRRDEAQTIADAGNAGESALGTARAYSQRKRKR